MQNFSALLIPALFVFVSCFALAHKVDVYDALTDGASDGLRVVVRIVPSLTALLAAVYMLRASDALTLLSAPLSPLFERLGVPVETLPLLLIRPLSGSGALAVATEIMTRCGVDSEIGRTVAVMLGSSETTFYTIAVYCGAAGISKTRYMVPAGICADLAMFFASSFFTHLFFP